MMLLECIVAVIYPPSAKWETEVVWQVWAEGLSIRCPTFAAVSSIVSSFCSLCLVKFGI